MSDGSDIVLVQDVSQEIFCSVHMAILSIPVDRVKPEGRIELPSSKVPAVWGSFPSGILCGSGLLVHHPVTGLAHVRRVLLRHYCRQSRGRLPGRVLCNSMHFEVSPVCESSGEPDWRTQAKGSGWSDPRPLRGLRSVPGE